MGQRAQRHGGSPSPPARTRMGATVEPFLIRTPEEAENVWPVAEAILPVEIIKQLTPEGQRVLLSAFRENSALAYRCLRWARWMATNRQLKVTCLKCPSMTAWSHTAVSHKLRDGTSRIRGKWQWICPKKPVDPTGCGKRFFDTTGTPFCHERVRPGVVFAALAYSSSGVIQWLLQKHRKTIELRELQTVLATMSDQTLHHRLTQYARLFCGTVLLRDCQELTRSFAGVQALEERLRALHRSLSVAAEYDLPAIRQRQASYARLKKLVCALQDLDKDPPDEQALQRLNDRETRWKGLQDAVQTLRAPITPVPVNLQALLAEASL